MARQSPSGGDGVISLNPRDPAKSPRPGDRWRDRNLTTYTVERVTSLCVLMRSQVGIPTLFDLVELEQSDLIEEIA